jgi:alpha-ketoglutarate-dependent taurine dioxygenase
MIGMKERVLYSDRRSPLVLEPAAGDRELSRMLQGQRSVLEQKLLQHGALLFRGFAVHDVSGFDRFVGAVTPERLDYVYGSTPRTALGNRIFTATEYPPAQEIPLHNENAYQREWPLKIALCCLTPATKGGETPIADMQAVTAAIGPQLVNKFAQRGVRYVRHYRPYIDVPWQTVFRTEDRSVVARFCAEHDIQHEWLDKDTLRTTQTCQGVARHPVTGEQVFFNQAHLFHISSLGEQAAKSMLDVFGANRLPRQTFFGDGAEISASDLAAVRTAFSAASLTFPWQAGDILLLDNMQFAHGRRPFEGPRKVVAALMEPHSESEASPAVSATR